MLNFSELLLVRSHFLITGVITTTLPPTPITPTSKSYCHDIHIRSGDVAQRLTCARTDRIGPNAESDPRRHCGLAETTMTTNERNKRKQVLSVDFGHGAVEMRLVRRRVSGAAHPIKTYDEAANLFRARKIAAKISSRALTTAITNSTPTGVGGVINISPTCRCLRSISSRSSGPKTQI